MCDGDILVATAVPEQKKECRPEINRMAVKTRLVSFTAALGVMLGLLASATPLFAVSVKTLYSFCSSANCPDGSSPFGGVILDSAGNLYGTTYYWGTGQQCAANHGYCGTVFELTPSNGTWTEKVLYSFCSASNCTDGAQPAAGVIFDKSGNLFGTTYRGGAYGLGTIFELTPNNGQWTEKVLYSFGATSVYPASPGAIVFGKDGNLYGTTSGGGTGQGCFVGGCGTVFELMQHNGQWTGKVLHNFDHNGQDGFDPLAGVSFDSAGNLYSTTGSGGADDSDCNGYGCGTVFELSRGTNGQWTEKILHSFYNNGTDGTAPYIGVIFDSAGNLYGTTDTGGADSSDCSGDGCGTVFELSPGTNGQWTEKILYSFFFSGPSGVYPNSLVLGSRALYGTTGSGGIYTYWGTIFELTPGNSQWNETVLHSFTDSGRDGAKPDNASLVADKTGNGYGATAQGGGRLQSGVVYEITP
jgi:uncharacterized repeat protein (TIGR03803 family)